MIEKIKRSMAVHPTPVVLLDEGLRARHPTAGDRSKTNKLWEHGEWWDVNQGKWDGDWGYRITRVTNSVDYRPGWALSKMQVEQLINEGWTVSVLSK